MKINTGTLLISFVILIISSHVGAAAPLVVTQGRASQRAGTKLVDVYYSVSGGAPPYTVTLQGSLDEGATWSLPVTTVSGNVGSGVLAGNNLIVTWNAGADWAGQFGNKIRFKVTATDLLSPFPFYDTGNFASKGWTITRNVYNGNFDDWNDIWWDNYLQGPNTATKTITIPSNLRYLPIKLTYKRFVSNNRLKVYFNNTLLESVENHDCSDWSPLITKVFDVTKLIPPSGVATIRFENDDIYQYWNHTRIDDIFLSY